MSLLIVRTQGIAEAIWENTQKIKKRKYKKRPLLNGDFFTLQFYLFLLTA